MPQQSAGLSLRDRLKKPEILVAPGVYDALTAVLAESAGFDALYLSGAGVAYTRLGQPDIGLVSMVEIVETIALVRDRVGVNLIVDADTGYGNALNVQRTVRTFERAGANAIQIEDQTYPKRCGHLADKSLISTGEMAGKIKAAVDARASDETLVIARTDAIGVQGFEQAVERARAYVDAGADVLFLEAPRTSDQLMRIVQTLGRKIPLMANMVEGGQTPIMSAAELEALGFSLVIFPGAVVRVVAKAAQDFYRTLYENGTSTPLAGRMFDFDALNQVIGTPDILALGRQYEAVTSRRSGPSRTP